MKYKQWKPAPCVSGAVKVMQTQGVPPLVAAVLCARGLNTAEEASAILSPDYPLINSPLLLRDMDQAVRRIGHALENREKIAVYGDYDVDGITATCLLTHYLRSRGGCVLPYIPDRIEEGYGLNRDAITALHGAGVSLIVTVDCGITALEETGYAHELGLDVIITDHHECRELLPDAAAVVNPHRKDCGYPFRCLAGVGVALKLVLALGGPACERKLLSQYADLAAIGTIADVMQLLGENRTIVRLGLDAMKNTLRPGLSALLHEAGAEAKPIDSSCIGYTIAPRLNAAGRMGCAAVAAELLLSDDFGRASELARALCDLNRERQAVEWEIFASCTTLLEREPASSRRAIVLADSGWHQGVVGIVASRLAEKYSCPAFIICLQNGMGKGSCRSYAGLNVYEALEHCGDLLEGFGGHALAAGFTILEENVSAFRARMEDWVAACTGGAELTSVLQVDVEVEDPALLSRSGVEALSLLEPFGAGNPRPVFSLSGATVACLADVGGGRHLKLRVSRDGYTFDAIFFSATAAQCELAAGDRADIAFYPQINEFRGERSVQLHVVDIRPALTRAQTEQFLLEKLLRGERLSAKQAQLLIPTREEFAGLWRFLRRHAAENRLEETVCCLSHGMARTYGLRERIVHTRVCLEVLDECGLIELDRRTDVVRILLREAPDKVDLEQSSMMQKLRSMMTE